MFCYSIYSVSMKRALCHTPWSSQLVRALNTLVSTLLGNFFIWMLAKNVSIAVSGLGCTEIDKTELSSCISTSKSPFSAFSYIKLLKLRLAISSHAASRIESEAALLLESWVRRISLRCVQVPPYTIFSRMFSSHELKLVKAISPS